MNNISKKLAIKAELLRHLETATKMRDEGRPSSYFKALFLSVNITRVDNDQEPVFSTKEWEGLMRLGE